MRNEADYLKALEAAIIINHQCKPIHRGTAVVIEKTADDEIVWDGKVEAFDLRGHKQAKTCYAWQHSDRNGNVKIFAVLENQFIDSPKKAVQSAIFVGIQPPISKLQKDLEEIRDDLVKCKNILQQITGKVVNRPPETDEEKPGKPTRYCGSDLL